MICATRARPSGLAAGASPRTGMKTLGHSQIGQTMNTYAHVLPEIEREAIDAAAKVIFECRTGRTPWLHSGQPEPCMRPPGLGLTWEPVSGFEPLTCRLQDGCSAD
jgi:hypothetical protein